MITIKESNLPDWQDTIVDEVYNVLKNNRIYAEVYDDYDFSGNDNSFVLCVEINDGDWKHEHKTADNVIVNLLDNYDNVEVTNLGEDVTNEDGSDTYSSIHKYHIIRTEGNNDVIDNIASQQLDIKFANERLNRKSRKRVNESIYTDNGFRNRAEYLQSLADDYNVSITDVKALASLLGPEEDFDALVSEVEDLADDDIETNNEKTGLDYYLDEYNYVVVSDGDFIVGFDKFEDAYDEVLQLLTRFDSDATLYDTFKNTKTAYKCGKIDYNKLNQFDYTEEEKDYYSYPYVLFVKEIGGSKAVDNIKKALKMAEVETKKINESCNLKENNKKNDEAYGRYMVKFTSYKNMFKFDYIDNYFDRSDYCFFDKNGYVDTDYSGISKKLFDKLYDKDMKPNKVYEIYTNTPHGEVLYYEEVPSHWFK